MSNSFLPIYNFNEEDPFDNNLFFSTEMQTPMLVRRSFPELNQIIIEFNKEQNNLFLNNYRWDIRTLGFAFEEEDLAVVQAIAWDKKNREKFLNLWGINIKTGEIKLISTKEKTIPLEQNAVVLELTYEK